MEEQKNFITKIKTLFSTHKKAGIITISSILAIIIAVVVIININGNRGKTVPVADAGTESPTEKITESETDTGKETEGTTESQTEADKKYINPYTGEKTDKDVSNIRPYAVMLNTIRQALPQSGNSYADMYIEMTEEGGITRVLGIYQNIDDVPKIGSVRSTREYYLSWVMGLDAILVHAGGDSWVFDEIKKTGYTSLNCVGDAGYYAMSAFYRDPYRRDTVGSEHSLYTTGPGLLEVATGYGISPYHSTDNYTRFNFAKDGDGTPEGGAPANNVQVTFSGYKTTNFVYDANTKDYSVYFWEDPYIDELNSEQIKVKNIIILPVPNWTAPDAWGKVRQKYDMSGGSGFYISGGKCTTINWTKGDYNKESEYGNVFNMTNEDGSPVELSVGKTYICMMSNAYPPVIN